MLHGARSKTLPYGPSGLYIKECMDIKIAWGQLVNNYGSFSMQLSICITCWVAWERDQCTTTNFASLASAGAVVLAAAALEVMNLIALMLDSSLAEEKPTPLLMQATEDKEIKVNGINNKLTTWCWCMFSMKGKKKNLW